MPFFKFPSAAYCSQSAHGTKISIFIMYYICGVPQGTHERDKEAGARLLTTLGEAFMHIYDIWIMERCKPFGEGAATMAAG